MNILISSMAMSYLSGAPLYNYEMCMELVKRGHTVSMCSEWTDNVHGIEGYKLRENLEKAGVKIIEIKTLVGLEANYDLLIASEKISEKLIPLLPETPIINVIHSEYDYEEPIPDCPQIIKYVCIRYNIMWHIIGQHNIPKEKCVVIYNGIDRERFKPVKKTKRDFEKVVVPCTIDTLREKFLNEIISTASEKRRIEIFGFDCGAKLIESPWVTIHPDKFNIEEDIADADEVVGILLGRINLEAWSCGVKSTVYDPDTLSHITYDPPVDFDKKHNIKNVVDEFLKFIVNIDDVTVIIPHHNRIDKLSYLMTDLTFVKNILIRRGGTFAENNNKLFSLVETKYVLFLNDDSRINRNVVRGLINMMKYYDIAGCLMQEGCTGFNIINGVLEQVNDYNLPVKYPSGACLMIKTDVFKKLLFNEKFRNGCEDIDLYLRAEKKGYRIGIYKDIKLQHEEGSSEGRYLYSDKNKKIFNSLWKNKCQIN